MFDKKAFKKALKDTSKDIGVPVERLIAFGNAALVLLGEIPDSMTFTIEVSKEDFETIKTNKPENYSPVPYPKWHPRKGYTKDVMTFGSMAFVKADWPYYPLLTEVTEGITHKVLGLVINEGLAIEQLQERHQDPEPI